MQMACESPSQAPAAQVASLDAALDALEACLDALGPVEDFDAAAAALAGPVRALGAAAREAMR
jgi:hypothetical protein